MRPEHEIPFECGEIHRDLRGADPPAPTSSPSSRLLQQKLVPISTGGLTGAPGPALPFDQPPGGPESLALSLVEGEGNTSG